MIGERWALATTLSASSDLADAQGDLARAAALTDEALELATQLEAPAEMAELLCRRGSRSLATGNLDAAHDDFERAGELARRAGSAEAVAMTHLGLAMLARRRGERERTRAELEAALASCPAEGFGPAAARTRILVEYGLLAELDGHLSIAAAWYRQGVEASLPQPNANAAADALLGLAGLARRAGHAERAAVLVGAAEVVGNGMGPARPEAATLLADLRTALPGPALTAALARGRAMNRAQIHAFAAT
jgi:tetratricopeptide (TPR) repeat protein